MGAKVRSKKVEKRVLSFISSISTRHNVVEVGEGEGSLLACPSVYGARITGASSHSKSCSRTCFKHCELFQNYKLFFRSPSPPGSPSLPLSLYWPSSLQCKKFLGFSEIVLKNKTGHFIPGLRVGIKFLVKSNKTPQPRKQVPGNVQ